MPKLIDVIAPSALKAAASLLRQQVAVPKSPIRRLDDGRVELCAAAALVIANTAFQNRRETLIAQFEAGGAEAVIDAFSDLGWPREVGLQLLQTNDAFDDENRRSNVLAIFEAA